MREYLYAPEVIRVAIVLGVVVSMLFYEKVQLTTGGAIVPAYLAVSLPHPLLIVTTLLAGLATWGVVHVWLPRHRILYGRRKFEVEVLVGLAFIMLGTVAAALLRTYSPMFLALTGIGFLVPGIIAHDMGRQGPKRTLQAIVATTLILGVCVYVLVSVLQLLDAAPQGDAALLASVLGFPRQLLIVAAAASVIIGMAVFSQLGLRTGGFITGAYLALVGPRWPDIAFALVCGVVTWTIVVHGSCRACSSSAAASWPRWS